MTEDFGVCYSSIFLLKERLPGRGEDKCTYIFKSHEQFPNLETR